jgi:hypothetical protein
VRVTALSDRLPERRELGEHADALADDDQCDRGDDGDDGSEVVQLEDVAGAERVPSWVPK